MLMAVLCNSLVGAVLGMRFKVRVLFPVAPFVFAVTAGAVGLAQAAFLPALLAGILAVVTLQIGYLGGLFTRWSVVAARLSPKRRLRTLPRRADIPSGKL
jgi:hypothetical protein